MRRDGTAVRDCVNRALKCTYTQAPGGNTQAANPGDRVDFQIQPDIRDRVDEDDAVPPSRSTTAIFELQLLHIYITAASPSLSNLFETSSAVWQVDVVALASKHDYLLNGIFLLAALYEASHSQNPLSSRSLRLKAAEYLVAAIEGFRTQLQEPSTADPDALFAMSIIIVLNMLVRLQQLPAGPALSWECLSNKLIDVCR